MDHGLTQFFLTVQGFHLIRLINDIHEVDKFASPLEDTVKASRKLPVFREIQDRCLPKITMATLTVSCIQTINNQ